jgi:hypothetical protein
MSRHREQWKALQDRKSGETPDVRKITKALPVIKWTQAFADFLHREIGVRSIPLAYVIRDEVNIPGTAPALLAGQPHSNKHGSIEAELVACAQHTHALYRDDNANVYYRLEEATRKRLRMLPRSNLFNVRKMEEVLSKHSKISTLDKTSGRLNSRNKMIS